MNSPHAGWDTTPSCAHESKVESQSMRNEETPVLATKSSARARSSCVPSPRIRTSSPWSRANCSTPGASRRQVGQWGAQNHTRTGRSAGASDDNSRLSPLATSTTVTAGSSLLSSAAGAGAGGADSAGGGAGASVLSSAAGAGGGGSGSGCGAGSGEGAGAGGWVATRWLSVLLQAAALSTAMLRTATPNRVRTDVVRRCGGRRRVGSWMLFTLRPRGFRTTSEQRITPADPRSPRRRRYAVRSGRRSRTSR